MKTHELKIKPEYFYPVLEGKKTFEIRKNDRDFGVGDIVRLNKFNDEYFDGDYVVGKITYITDYAQKEGYVVFSFEIISQVG